MANQKLYPFSVQKHAHDIEYRKNRVWLTMRDMESGEIPWDDAQYDKLESELEALRDLYDAVIFGGNGRIAYLTGKQIGLAKECVAWASNSRASHLVEAGKTQYLQYC